MYESALRTARGEIEVIAVYDHDDDSIGSYPEGPTYVLNEERRLQSYLWTIAAGHARGDVLHMSADDLRYESVGWDVEVARAFKRWREPIGMVYVNDTHPLSNKPYMGQKPTDAIDGKYPFACNPFISREWFEATGEFTPDGFQSWEADTHVYLVAESISRVQYLGDVIVKHRHPMVDPSVPMDETYMRGAAGNPRLKRIGWAKTRSKPYRLLRAEQSRKLTGAIQSYRRPAEVA